MLSDCIVESTASCILDQSRISTGYFTEHLRSSCDVDAADNVSCSKVPGLALLFSSIQAKRIVEFLPIGKMRNLFKNRKTLPNSIGRTPILDVNVCFAERFRK